MLAKTTTATKLIFGAFEPSTLVLFHEECLSFSFYVHGWKKALLCFSCLNPLCLRLEFKTFQVLSFRPSSWRNPLKENFLVVSKVNLFKFLSSQIEKSRNLQRYNCVDTECVSFYKLNERKWTKAASKEVAVSSLPSIHFSTWWSPEERGALRTRSTLIPTNKDILNLWRNVPSSLKKHREKTAYIQQKWSCCRSVSPKAMQAAIQRATCFRVVSHELL